MSRFTHSNAFSLVELLVVVTIIVILIALLVPATDKALEQAMKTQCLSNVRGTVAAAAHYAVENKRTLPVFTMTGERTPDGLAADGSSAYDMRGPWGGLFAVAGAKVPMGIGLLVPTGFLPSTQLGKIAHCPMMDNSGSTFGGHCMDVAHPYGYGASWWVEDPTHRIVNGYNYRAPSYYNAGKGHIRLNDISGDLLLYVDTPDVRFRGREGRYVHTDGYSRAMGDGSASFLLDPHFLVEQRLLALHPPDGSGHEGHMAGIGSPWDASMEEEIYDYMSRGSVAQ